MGSITEAFAQDKDFDFARKLNHLHAPDCTWTELSDAMFEASMLRDGVISAMLIRMERLAKAVADLAGIPEAHV